jgi:uncharacterized protein YciW
MPMSDENNPFSELRAAMPWPKPKEELAEVVKLLQEHGCTERLEQLLAYARGLAAKTVNDVAERDSQLADLGLKAPAAGPRN